MSLGSHQENVRVNAQIDRFIWGALEGGGGLGIIHIRVNSKFSFYMFVRLVLHN